MLTLGVPSAPVWLPTQTLIPTGSTVIVGDKTYIALNVGVKGEHIDILMTHEEAAVAGVRRETVWWCEE